MVDSKKVQVISNGLKENISSNKIIYYNGITLDEGVKSNASIDNKAKALVSRDTSDRGKARSIYRWVGSNVIYDDEKADSIMENTSSFESGAIPTFRDKRGICFDYACLYTAMCNAIGLKNRIIVGDAYNGSEFVSHAWNQVYLEDEGKWINVDPTFYISGNYFDSSNFEETHRTKNIAGEF
jgi:transglutaminase/protease-like cytokinesis protein 3